MEDSIQNYKGLQGALSRHAYHQVAVNETGARLLWCIQK